MHICDENPVVNLKSIYNDMKTTNKEYISHVEKDSKSDGIYIESNQLDVVVINRLEHDTFTANYGKITDVGIKNELNGNMDINPAQEGLKGK